MHSHNNLKEILSSAIEDFVYEDTFRYLTKIVLNM